MKTQLPGEEDSKNTRKVEKFFLYLREFINPKRRSHQDREQRVHRWEVRIYTMQHDIDSPDFGELEGDVVIEDYAVIGTRVTILPGVHIGNGAVVGSGAGRDARRGAI